MVSDLHTGQEQDERDRGGLLSLREAAVLVRDTETAALLAGRLRDWSMCFGLSASDRTSAVALQLG